ncbi:MAG: hypothetical protein P4L36_08070 [Holophaga sp.]|nr:hypothetical protein [Holophaga sp.]
MFHARAIAPLLLLLASWSGGAQDAPTPRLVEGSPVALVFTTALSSAKAAVGDSVGFVLVDGIKVDGLVVAKAGTTVSGRVTYVRRAGLAGRSGRIGLELGALSAGKDRIELRGSQERGSGGEVVVKQPHHLKWPMGLLRDGDELEIGEGRPLTVFVAKETLLSPRS